MLFNKYIVFIMYHVLFYNPYSIHQFNLHYDPWVETITVPILQTETQAQRG